jgi:hypothetical protein
MKKVRPESKLKTLSEETQETLWQLLNVAMDGRENPMTYDEARAWLLADHGVSTSNAAMSEWYSWYGLRQRMERAQERASQAQTKALALDPSLDASHLERLGQMVFTAETLEDGNVKGFVELLKLKAKEQERELKRQSLELDARRVALLEQKAAMADAAKEIVNSDASEEEKSAKMKALFGMGA